MQSIFPHPFKYVRSIGQSDNDFTDPGEQFEAIFALPDDGCPNSGQALRIVVTTYENGINDIDLSVVTSGGEKEHKLGTFDTTMTTALSALLYGAARKVTRTYFEPL